MPTRRQFLRDFSLVASAASLTPAAVLARNSTWRGRAPERLLFQLFAERLNTFFNVQAGPATVGLLLVQASRLPPSAPNAQDARNERFSLLFRGPLPQPLSQDTYLFEHPGLGRLGIFIVPTICEPDTAHCYYEAVFNYPVHPADIAAQLSRAPLPLRES
ncbi:MAG TPA: hypothetical protein VN578_14555 [Candidatus Binatia bacterium]|jgi:hypothetical protein|nr:hypothetical protein [Candidatus Binatia bacterium]